MAARRRVAQFQARADDLVDQPELHRQAVKLALLMHDSLFEMEETHRILEQVYRSSRR